MVLDPELKSYKDTPSGIITPDIGESAELQIQETENQTRDIELAANPQAKGNDITTGTGQSSTQYRTLYVNALQLQIICQELKLPLPDVPRKEIQDKSKGDAFVKGTAIVQVIWLFITLLARAKKDLPVAQLEIGVLAFAVCAFTAYLFSWSKPQDVKTPIPIYINKQLSQEAKNRLWEMETSFVDVFQDVYTRKLENPLPNASFCSKKDEMGVASCAALSLYIAACIFGSIHCIAWNFPFPTSVERTLWRCAGVTQSALPLLSFRLSFYVITLGDHIWTGMNQAFLVLYFFTRLVIFGEMFRSPFFLSPNGYVTTWANSVPHLS
jgi:hypothetical protein